MNIYIKPILSKTEWQETESKLAPHTFLQSWEWSLSQEALGHKIFRLGIYRNDDLIGLAFVYFIKAKRGSFLFCPHGPVIDWSRAGEVMQEFLNYLIKLGREEKADFIRLSPLAPDNESSRHVFACLGFRPAPVHMMHPELSWMLDLKPSEQEILNNMEKRTRYSIRKAEKDGVIIKSGAGPAELDAFYALYQETASRQKFVPYSKEYLAKELESFVKNSKIMIYLAYYQEELIASAVIVYSNDSAFYHHGASLRTHANITASEFLQWAVIKDAKNRGLKFYNFWGVAPEEESKHPWAGLSKFKKGFGGHAEAYLHARDFELTAKYWLNYAVEKLRKLKRGY